MTLHGIVRQHGDKHRGHHSESESKFQVISHAWEKARDGVSNCFINLENDLASNKKQQNNNDKKNDQDGTKPKKHGGIAKVAGKFLDEADEVNKQMIWIGKVEDKIHDMGDHHHHCC